MGFKISRPDSLCFLCRGLKPWEWEMHYIGIVISRDLSILSLYISGVVYVLPFDVHKNSMECLSWLYIRNCYQCKCGCFPLLSIDCKSRFTFKPVAHLGKRLCTYPCSVPIPEVNKLLDNHAEDDPRIIVLTSRATIFAFVLGNAIHLGEGDDPFSWAVEGLGIFSGHDFLHESLKISMVAFCKHLNVFFPKCWTPHIKICKAFGGHTAFFWLLCLHTHKCLWTHNPDRKSVV